MTHVKTLIAATLKQVTDPKCRECATSCQSACKTSCTVGNQVCQK